MKKHWWDKEEKTRLSINPISIVFYLVVLLLCALAYFDNDEHRAANARAIAKERSLNCEIFCITHQSYYTSEAECYNECLSRLSR